MRYGTTTKKSVEDVLDRAHAFFGPGGELGLPETSSTSGTASFGDETGGVVVTAEASGPGETGVTILSREYDHWAERFLQELA